MSRNEMSPLSQDDPVLNHDRTVAAARSHGSAGAEPRVPVHFANPSAKSSYSVLVIRVTRTAMSSPSIARVTDGTNVPCLAHADDAQPFASRAFRHSSCRCTKASWEVTTWVRGEAARSSAISSIRIATVCP